MDPRRDDGVRFHTATSLVNLGDMRPIGPLLRVLRGGIRNYEIVRKMEDVHDRARRERAAGALGRIRTPEAV